MGKSTGFLEFDRLTSLSIEPEQRVKNFDEFHVPLSKELQMRQGSRCMDCGVPFCHTGVTMGGMSSGCPLGNLIPEWNDLVFNDSYKYALDRLLMTNCFPEFTGRVCPAGCESACTCGLNGEPVTIKENELAIIENAYDQGLMRPAPPKSRSDKRIAIVGSGPSGLAAAETLNKRGHNVTVFEREDRIGGLLMYGIPNMKLDKKIVERRVSLMALEGVEFKCGVDVGKDIAANELLREFSAVILACGASNPRDINVPGRQAKGIHFAVDFLKSTTKSLLSSNLQDGNYLSAKGKRVMVIGGGDTGNDCVGTAIRHGAESVVQLEMMPKRPDEREQSNPWPQWPLVSKTDYGQEEAIWRFGNDPRVYETTVKEFLVDEKGNLKGAVTVKLAWTPDPKTGRMSMSEVEGSKQTLKVDLVLIAAGFLGSDSYVSEAFNIESDARTNIKADGNDYKTTSAKVFATGDCRRGQSLVVWAIREGREAARAVELDLFGFSNI